MTNIIPAAPSPAEVVRAMACHLCGTAPGVACTPGGDHLARWLCAYGQERITRDELKHVIACLVVVTKWCLVTQEEAR